MAVVASVDADTGELGMQLAPDFIIPVFVTDNTDISDANEDPLEGDNLMVGMILRGRGGALETASWARKFEWPIWKTS